MAERKWLNTCALVQQNQYKAMQWSVGPAPLTVPSVIPPVVAPVFDPNHQVERVVTVEVNIAPLIVPNLGTLGCVP